jgi:DNA-binding FrmR family transcriptional regulator
VITHGHLSVSRTPAVLFDRERAHILLSRRRCVRQFQHHTIARAAPRSILRAADAARQRAWPNTSRRHRRRARRVRESQPMLGKNDQLLIASHLHRIEGQLRGIQRMIEEPRRCVDILQQLAAVEAALSRVSIDVFRIHVIDTMGNGAAASEVDPRQAIEDVMAFVEKYSRLAKMSK